MASHRDAGRFRPANEVSRKSAVAPAAKAKTAAQSAAKPAGPPADRAVTAQKLKSRAGVVQAIAAAIGHHLGESSCGALRVQNEAGSGLEGFLTSLGL